MYLVRDYEGEEFFSKKEKWNEVLWKDKQKTIIKWRRG